jgi:hypothetical protein
MVVISGLVMTTLLAEVVTVPAAAPESVEIAATPSSTAVVTAAVTSTKAKAKAATSESVTATAVKKSSTHLFHLSVVYYIRFYFYFIYPSSYWRR